MSDFIQLEVDIGIAKKWILLQKDAKVAEIFLSIFRECANDNILLYNQGRCVTYNDESSVSDCGLNHLSKLELLVTVAGGVWPLNALKERKTDLQPLPGFITATTSPTEPDMITLEADPGEKRARVPCGHIIGPSSMTSYCQSLLSEGKFKFVCPSPKCDREWEYFLVRHVACLTDEESREFEKKISENYLKKADGLQRCPRCTVWCYKASGMGDFVRCPMCNKSFCWACLRDWIASSDSRLCGNADCDGRDGREKVLANCPTKKIYACNACPSIRACPKCLLLTEHKDQCGHVTCPSCKHGFCFICLKGKKSDGGWSCSPAGDCPLAPRQVPGAVVSGQSSKCVVM